jgi:hypothetical protein
MNITSNAELPDVTRRRTFPFEDFGTSHDERNSGKFHMVQGPTAWMMQATHTIGPQSDPHCLDCIVYAVS